MYQSSLIVGPLSRCDVSVEVYQADNLPDCWLLEISTNTGAAGGLPARTRKSGPSGDSFRERSKLAETSAMSRQKSAPRQPGGPPTAEWKMGWPASSAARPQVSAVGPTSSV